MEKHWKQKKVSAKWRALIEKDVCIPAVISLCVYLLLCNTHMHSALCLFRECRTRQNLHTSPSWLEHTQYTRVEPVRQHLLVLHQKHDRVLSWGSFIFFCILEYMATCVFKLIVYILLAILSHKQQPWDFLPSHCLCFNWSLTSGALLQCLGVSVIVMNWSSSDNLDSNLSSDRTSSVSVLALAPCSNWRKMQTAGQFVWYTCSTVYQRK